MRPGGRMRHVLKWVGALLCTTCLAAGVLGRFAVVKIGGWLELGGNHSGGCLTLYWPPYPRPRWVAFYYWPRDLEVWPICYVAEENLMETAGTLTVMIPLWIPFAIGVIPTVCLWWRDRRYPPGHCQTCGYNLTGNVSGRCPECGEAT